MQGLRAFGFSDAEIAHELQVFLLGPPQQGFKWKTVYYRLHAHLRRLADGDTRAVNSRSNQ